MMTSLSIATAFAFMLVVATTTANPVLNEENSKLNRMLNQDPVKAIKYFWNKEIGKDRSAQAINPWNDNIIEEDQKKSYER